MNLNERPIPEAALRDPDSVEMMRIWIAEQALHCSLKVGMYQEGMGVAEEKAWGKILADAALHVANALREGYGADPREAVRSIREAFLEELESEHIETSGFIINRQ